MFKFSLIAFSVFVSISTFANQHEKLELRNIQVGATAVAQSSGESYSGIIRYNPFYRLNEKIKLGLSLDLTPLKLNDNSTFIALGYLANGYYQINEKFGAQISAGLNTWSCTDCKTAFTAGVLGTYRYSPSWFKYMDQIFVQYLNIDQKSRASQLVIGTNLSF